MIMNHIESLTDRAHENAKSKGFWDGWSGTDAEVAMRLALIHSEVSEALEALREGKRESYLEGSKPCGFPSELADIVIRVMDLAGGMGINLGNEIIEKMAYNATRQSKHGKGF